MPIAEETQFLELLQHAIALTPCRIDDEYEFRRWLKSEKWISPPEPTVDALIQFRRIKWNNPTFDFVCDAAQQHAHTSLPAALICISFSRHPNDRLGRLIRPQVVAAATQRLNHYQTPFLHYLQQDRWGGSIIWFWNQTDYATCQALSPRQALQQMKVAMVKRMPHWVAALAIYQPHTCAQLTPAQQQLWPGVQELAQLGDAPIPDTLALQMALWPPQYYPAINEFSPIDSFSAWGLPRERLQYLLQSQKPSPRPTTPTNDRIYDQRLLITPRAIYRAGLDYPDALWLDATTLSTFPLFPHDCSPFVKQWCLLHRLTLHKAASQAQADGTQLERWWEANRELLDDPTTDDSDFFWRFLEDCVINGGTETLYWATQCALALRAHPKADRRIRFLKEIYRQLTQTEDPEPWISPGVRAMANESRARLLRDGLIPLGWEPTYAELELLL